MPEVFPALMNLLKHPDKPGAMLLFALVIGALVRVLRTKKVGELLDAAPPSWVKRIPKWLIPWVGVGIGAVLSVLNARFNVGATWLDSLGYGVTGVFDGWMASGGHETFGKLAGIFLYKPIGPFNPPPPSPPPAGPPVPAALTPDAAKNGASDAEALDGSKPIEIENGKVKS